MKMVAELEPNEKLVPSRPAKATLPSTPSVDLMISDGGSSPLRYAQATSPAAVG
jgi:hypothetical protein